MIVSSLLDTVNPRISAESQLNAGSSDKRRVPNKRRVTGGYDYDGMYTVISGLTMNRHLVASKQ